MNQARAAFIVTEDADDPERLLLMPSKMNIAPIKHGLAYRIEGHAIDANGQTILTSRIGWESTPVTITADQALAAHDEKREGKTAKAEAIDVLRDLLSRGELPVKDLETAARNAGVTSKPLRDCKECIGRRLPAGGFRPWCRLVLEAPHHRCPTRP